MGSDWKASPKMCISIFKKKDTVTIKPTSTKRIGNSDLRALLRSKFPEAAIYLSDGDYLLCNPGDMKAFLEQDDTNKHTYETEKCWKHGKVTKYYLW